MAITSLMLAVLLLRAYVPVGFMPAAGNPLRLELCPAALPLPMTGAMAMAASMEMPASMEMTTPMEMPASMPMPAHHRHQHSTPQTHSEDCPFGSAPSAGPISQPHGLEPGGKIASLPAPGLEPLRSGTRPQRAHRARAPPSLA